MEWVEITGKTVEEATEIALDQLGVAVQDAEVLVITEPRTGLFGRVKDEARVRARVRPATPRPKRYDRQRDRSRQRGGSDRHRERSGGEQRSRSKEGSSTGKAGSGSERLDSGVGGEKAERPAGESGPPRRRSRSRNRTRDRSQAPASSVKGVGGGGRSQNGSRTGADRREDLQTPVEGEMKMAEGMTLEEQAEVARTFLQGLLDEFGFEASVETRLLDEETLEVAANGEGLGLLVGPKGATLAALQDLTRTAVQHQCSSRTDRILVDVAGYRQRRIEALQRFSTQIAEEALSSGSERALEPMSPADRKVVHDTVNALEGVNTRSEGEDPDRYVVIAPA